MMLVAAEGEFLCSSRWVLLSRIGHQKRKRRVKLELSSMVWVNGVQYSRIQSLTVSYIFAQMSISRFANVVGSCAYLFIFGKC